MKFIRFTANWLTVWAILPVVYLVLVFARDCDEEMSDHFIIKDFWDSFWK